MFKVIKTKLKKFLENAMSFMYYKINKTQTKHFCSVCGSDVVRFLPLSKEFKKQSEIYGYKYFDKAEMLSIYSYLCPICNASDRERFYAYWLRNYVKDSKITSKQKLIHFAPEDSLSKYLKNEEIFEYYTADLFMENMDFKADLMNLPFENDEYDFFICSHILEHVKDDRQVVSELYRILRKGGFGILVAPVCLAIEDTYEDSSIVLPQDRWKYFGQDDHVRLYSHKGFVDVIKSSGFEVIQLSIDDLGNELFYSLGLKETSILYVVKK